MSTALSWERIEEQIAGWMPAGVDRTEVFAGVRAALGDSERPIQKAIGSEGTRYAWRNEDASAVEVGLRVVAQLAAAGFAGPVMLGVAIKELVEFLIKLRRSQVELNDPLQIAILLKLKDDKRVGLSAATLWEQLQRDEAFKRFSVADIETALVELEKATSRAGDAKRLVMRSGSTWKSLV